MKRVSLMAFIVGLSLVGASCTTTSSVNTNGNTTNTTANTSVVDTSLANTNSDTFDTNLNTNTTPQPTTVTVSVTNTGFSPSTITIKKGTTVVFQNNGTKTHQVGSDPHPDHSDLSAFDLADMEPGASTQFTFVETGTFGYHNHNYDELTGTIIVID